MAHVGDELALQPVGFLGARLLQQDVGFLQLELMGSLLYRGLQLALFLPHDGDTPAKHQAYNQKHQDELEQAGPPRSPPWRADTKRESGGFGAPYPFGTPRQNFERVRSGR